MSVVHVDILRSDLVRALPSVTLRSRSTYVYLTLLAALAIGLELSVHGAPATRRDWIVILYSILAYWGIGLVCALLFSALDIFVTSSRKSGVLGAHTFTVTDGGVLEQTQASTNLIKWGGAAYLVRGTRAIIIGIASGAYYVLPRRSFPNDAAYESFWNLIQPLGAGAA